MDKLVVVAINNMWNITYSSHSHRGR